MKESLALTTKPAGLLIQRVLMDRPQALPPGDQMSLPATFESPLRSILVSSPPTASVSANTALASLSAANTTRSSSGPFAGLASASTRRATFRPEDMMSMSSSASRPPLMRLEKDLDDPEASSSSNAHDEHSLNTTIARLFVTSDSATPAAISRLPSHLRTLSNVGRSIHENSSLTNHLLLQGFSEGVHSDITIIAFGQRYRLHKLLLARIPFFQSAFSGPWAESSASEMELRPEEMDSNITKTAFELAIKRTYGSSSPIQEEQESIGLFATACWLNLPDVVENCVDSILKQMQPSRLHDLIRLVTSNFYGKPGDRILASAKAMLYRDGWEMEYSGWDMIPSEMIKDIVGGDPFFVPSEWERWFLASKILNRKLRIKATEVGLISEHGTFIYPKPVSLQFNAIRFDTTYRNRSMHSSARNISEKDDPWLALYTSPEIAPLLVLLDEGIHYMHLRFEQLQQIKSHRDVFGVPIVADDLISNALWMSMELRQRVLNAHENDLELGFQQYAYENNESAQNHSNPAADYKGKRPSEEREQETNEPDSESWDGNAQPRKFWIPNEDTSYMMGGTREAQAAAIGSATDWNHQATSRLSASLDAADVSWATDFLSEGGRPLSQNLSSGGPPRYSRFPPFRFAAEFPHTRSLKDKKRIYSKTLFYAGSLWNVYIQRIASSKTQQLGIYLHRAKESSPIDEPGGHLAGASVDDRIGHLEREMLLRKTQRRSRSLQDIDPQTSSSEGPHDDNSTPKGDVLDRARKEARSPEFWSDSLRNTTTNVTRLFDSDEEDDELLRATHQTSVPTIQPYVDTRPTIKSYFKIYSPDKAGLSMSVYESAPEKFVVSKSWGWKSSQMVPEDGSLPYDLAHPSRGSSLRYMVVIGNV
ncbi:uncharacterized protein AB675_5238 [Cyphellophora attinorum]|uniref:BTB domain-containing protein n=1 Tax=Cyphellophora attinorum TaxID=1664694 RepID=A0A0N0NLQ8_9EURO|nr:uncharacterized protein AB675_5238 [Phialophora attinorum]KPI39319.1 hypothetical protein AB675_5238 [Phialophora attinorum]